MNTRRCLPALTATGFLLWSLCCPASASLAPLADTFSKAEAPAEKVDLTRPEEIDRRIEDLTKERDTLAQQIQQSDVSSSSLAGRHLLRSQEKLEQIDRLLKAEASLAQALAAPTVTASEPLPEDKSSIFMLNALYEQQATADSALREKRSTLEASKEQLLSLTARSKEAKATLKESTEQNRDRYERAARSAALAVRMQKEQVNLDTMELHAAQSQAAQGGTLEARIAAVRERLAANEGEADGGISALMERENALLRAKNLAERQLATAELRLGAEKKRYASHPQSSGEALAVVEALTAYRDILGKQISLTTSELDRLVMLRDVWANWEALLRNAYIPEDLSNWQVLAESELSDLRQAEALRQGQLADLQIRLEGLEARIHQLPADSRARAALQEAEDALHKLHADLLAAERQLAADRRVTQRFGDEITTVTGNLSFFEYVARAAKQVKGLWNFDITTIDEAPFTVGSLTMGLLLFGAGLWASRLGASLVGRVAARRLKLDAGAVHAIQTISFYMLLIGFTLLALRAVHFPLTAFTFLGGALAIGVGFGSQNVMNNFISGLILMLERPVRAQDVVEIDGSHGVIQKIGPRSTHIRSTDGRHIVVPNSFFLESNVVNWTLSDDLMRSKVSVGVSYGSPTRLVKQLLEEVVSAEPLVLADPPPNVIFEAFGDNSLNFDVYFWVEARSPMSVNNVQSRVRFAIDDVFREHNLVIAYPQRDVHLDSLSPLDIRLVGNAENSPSEGGS